jgi:hypothetical protein
VPGRGDGDGAVRYDRTGHTYSRTRQADPRVAAVIDEALLGMTSVANIGAGAGSYEPAHTVVAVEPSQVMIAQRPPGCAARGPGRRRAAADPLELRGRRASRAHRAPLD